MYKFFVTEDQIEENQIIIKEEDVNHIKNVLRLEKCEKIEIANITNGCQYLSQIIELNSNTIKCEIIEQLDSTRETGLYLHIFQGLPKAEKLETIIQKTIEIGVCEITPVMMQRCVVKLDDKVKERKMIRWRKIAEVAAKQSKRDQIPKINNPINLKNIYEKLENYDIVLVAYENETENKIKRILQQITVKQKMRIAVIIGPEGGLEEQEVQDLIKKGAKTISLGTRILRTETAPIVLSSIIMYEFDEMK